MNRAIKVDMEERKRKELHRWGGRLSTFKEVSSSLAPLSRRSFIFTYSFLLLVVLVVVVVGYFGAWCGASSAGHDVPDQFPFVARSRTRYSGRMLLQPGF